MPGALADHRQAWRRRFGAVAALVLSGAMIGGCVTPAVCGSGLSPLAALECQARNGDAEAQFDLAVRLETGDGIAADPARAARLYRQAGSFRPGTQYIWVPGVSGQPGYVMPVVSGPDQAGLAKAQFHLAMMYLDGRGVAVDRRRASALLGEAAKAGYAPAAEALERLPPPR